MTLTVLTDDEICSLLENLTVDDLESFRKALGSALYEASTRGKGDTSAHQPERISVNNDVAETTTLFMPSCNSAGNGIKVITLSSPSTNDESTSTRNPGPDPSPRIPPTGAILLSTPQGRTVGLLHARTLTAFRTALASLCAVARRANRLRTLVVFGGGAQAYWHVRLVLRSVRGAEVERVVFVGRRRGRSKVEGEGGGQGDRCAEVVGRLRAAAAGKVGGDEGWGGCRFLSLSPGEDDDDAEYEARLAEVLREADVVFCCTPSTEPLFDGRVWDGEEASGKGRLIVAIGSYTPEMKEIPGEIVRRTLAGGGREGGVVVVDTIEGALKEAGELIEVGAKAEQLVELGELLGPDSEDKDSRKKLDECLELWNVIYKSVGVGVMDLAVGMHMVEFASAKGVGTSVEGF